MELIHVCPDNGRATLQRSLCRNTCKCTNLFLSQIHIMTSSKCTKQTQIYYPLSTLLYLQDYNIHVAFIFSATTFSSSPVPRVQVMEQPRIFPLGSAGAFQPNSTLCSSRTTTDKYLGEPGSSNRNKAVNNTYTLTSTCTCMNSTINCIIHVIVIVHVPTNMIIKVKCDVQ